MRVISAPSMLINTLAPGFSGPIHLIFGNVGARDSIETIAARFPNIHYHGDFANLSIDNLTIQITHFPEKAAELASGEADIIVYGHDHESVIQKEDDKILINPGSLGGLYSEASFAVFDTKLKEAQIINLQNI
jgi:putative phosphoesterase